METKETLLKYDILCDKKGVLLCAAINENNVERLVELINHGANINHPYYIKKAVQLRHWECAKLLIDKVRIFIISESRGVLFFAAWANETSVVQHFLKRVESKAFPYIGGYLFHVKPSSELFHGDKENKFTPLHWAVYHNNPEMCELFLKFDGVYKMFDAQKQTAFQLALSLNNDCVKSIAKGMSLVFAVTYFSNDLLARICIDNITFGDVGSPPYGYNKQSKAQKKIFATILELPKDDKEKALNSIFDKTTMLYALYKLGPRGHLEKYQLLAGKVLKDMQAHTVAQELNSTIESSVQELSVTIESSNKGKNSGDKGGAFFFNKSHASTGRKSREHHDNGSDIQTQKP